MLKRFFFPIFFLIFCNASVAQPIPTAAEIKSKKIKKIAVSRKDGEMKFLTEWYYDSHGNDTAKYDNGKRNWYKKIEYNAKQNPVKIIQYSDDGKPMEVSVYEYKPDNSFTIKNTDAQFGMVTTATYDKKKNIVNYTIPDGSQIKYNYNAKGLLIKSYSIPKNDGVKMTQTLTYNAKGKLAASHTVGDYPGSSIYEYNDAGLLFKTTSTRTMDGELQTATEEYTYFY